MELLQLDQSRIETIARAMDMLEIEPRDFAHPKFDPPIKTITHNVVPIYYLLQAAHACGAGVIDLTGGYENSPEANCSDVFMMFRKMFDYAPHWFDGKYLAMLDYPMAERMFDFSKQGKVMQQKDIYWRWKMTQSIGFYLLDMDPVQKWNYEAFYKCPGLQQDPVKKKANLAVLFIGNRPEGFFEHDMPLRPIIDYHVMRLMIRTGMIIGVPEEDTLDPFYERVLREYCFMGMERLVEACQNLNLDQIDFWMWQAGKKLCSYKEAKCDECPLMSFCGLLVEKKEPRIQTINY